jgi:phosphoserine phosphatase
MKGMTDPLPSWNDGAAKRRIVTAVRSMADENADTFVPPTRRLATFDNDGTLWCEKPSYVQAAFLLDRWREMAESDAGLRDTQPWKAAFEGDLAWFADLYGHLPEILKGVVAAHDGITPEAFEEAARSFFATARHPRFGVPYDQLAYRPMRELLDLLRASGFKVFVASAGGRDFMRAVSEEIYGVPRESVIGSSAVLEWSEGRVLRTRALTQPLDDGPGKPVHIYDRLGLPPVLAAGNADGDIQMLELARFGILLHHDDAEREYAYDAGAEKALEAAAAAGWVVVSMRRDFATVFDLAD